MEANQDMLQAGFMPASSYDEIRLPSFRSDRPPVAGFVPRLPVLCRCVTGGGRSKSCLLGGFTVAKKKAAKKKVAKKVAKKPAKKAAKKAAKK